MCCHALTAFDVGQLAGSLGNLNLVTKLRGELEVGDITPDDLALNMMLVPKLTAHGPVCAYLHILLILNSKSVNGSALLDLTGRLDGVVLEEAVLTLETLKDDISEVGNSEQKQAGDSGECDI